MLDPPTHLDQCLDLFCRPKVDVKLMCVVFGMKLVLPESFVG